MANNRILTASVHNPFKGKAGKVIRLLLSEPQRAWAGLAIAKELDCSQAWVNRLLDSLAKLGLVQRTSQGTKSQTQLLSTQHLLKKWVSLYSIDQNEQLFFYHPSKKPLQIMRSAQQKEGFLYALTGYAAVNAIKQTSHHAPPMVYLWPEKPDEQTFEALVKKLENVYGFIPVANQANIILLKPTQKESVFFKSLMVRGKPLVSAVQLYLDLYNLQRGLALIKELADFWREHQLDHEL